jgi:C_GCAxxG_C_C family probable redox protein
VAKDRNALKEQAQRLGFEYERDNRGCAQCTFAALQDALELHSPESDAVFKAASPLAGGVAGEADGQCGAYSGGVLLLGLMFGRERNAFSDPSQKRYKARDYASKFHEYFIEEYGSVTCEHIHRKLFGRTYCLRDPVDKAAYMAKGAYVDKCTNVVGKAAGWIVDILADAGEV